MVANDRLAKKEPVHEILVHVIIAKPPLNVLMLVCVFIYIYTSCANSEGSGESVHLRILV